MDQVYIEMNLYFGQRFSDDDRNFYLDIIKFYMKSSKCVSFRFGGHEQSCHWKKCAGRLLAYGGHICVHLVSIVLRRNVRPSPSWWLQMSWCQIGTRPSATTILSLPRPQTMKAVCFFLCCCRVIVSCRILVDFTYLYHLVKRVAVTWLIDMVPN